MKYLRLAPIFSALALCAAHAQHGDPEPIPDFSNLDEFIYEPKTTLSIGVRAVGGAKTSFQGKGVITALGENIGNTTDTGSNRTYHDGSVRADDRSTAVDNGDGTSTITPIFPDGKTQNWSFTDDRQSAVLPGYIAMHNYSASIVDPTSFAKDGAGSAGLELAVSRDMGKILHSRFSWSLMAGMTINDIAAKKTAHVLADLTTITDLYSLYGQVAPAAPYESTSASTTTTVVDAAGNPVLNSDGSTQTVTNSNQLLTSSAPISRTQSTTADTTSVTNLFKLKGAYYTFRAGSTLWLPISQRFRASVSMGATMIYAGSTYSITQTYQPDIGAEITDTLSGDTTRLLPGYFADATMQFDLTPRTGFYAGAVFQNSGDYSQTVTTTTASYSTKLEFGRQQGFRAGMTIKF